MIFEKYEFSNIILKNMLLENMYLLLLYIFQRYGRLKWKIMEGSVKRKKYIIDCK